MPATVKDSARDRDPLPLFSRGETLPEVESHHPDHPAARSRQVSRQGGIRQLHHDVAAARHKGNNRGKAWGQPPPARSGGKERDKKGPSRLAPSGYLGGGHLKMPRKALSGRGWEPLGPYAVGANKRGIRRAPDQLSRVSTTLASLSVSFTWLSSTKRRSGAMPWVSTRYSLVFWARRMARFRRDLAVMSC